MHYTESQYTSITKQTITETHRWKPLCYSMWREQGNHTLRFVAWSQASAQRAYISAPVKLTGHLRAIPTNDTFLSRVNLRVSAAKTLYPFPS